MWNTHLIIRNRLFGTWFYIHQNKVGKNKAIGYIFERFCKKNYFTVPEIANLLIYSLLILLRLQRKCEKLKSFFAMQIPSIKGSKYINYFIHYIMNAYYFFLYFYIDIINILLMMKVRWFQLLMFRTLPIDTSNFQKHEKTRYFEIPQTTVYNY